MKEKEYVTEYIRELGEFLSKFPKQVKKAQFSEVIKGLFGVEVLPLKSTDEKLNEVLLKITEACKIACKKAFDEGIESKRVNEVGNKIEPYMKDALNSLGFIAETPMTKDGIRQTSGYPDIYFETQDKIPFYLECKTYNRKSINTTLRSFYISPTERPKVTKDAYHLMVGFEVIEAEKRGDNILFKPIHWKIYSLESLMIGIKHEINASNRDLYTLDTMIAEGDTSQVIKEIIEKSTLDEFF